MLTAPSPYPCMQVHKEKEMGEETAAPLSWTEICFAPLSWTEIRFIRAIFQKTTWKISGCFPDLFGHLDMKFTTPLNRKQEPRSDFESGRGHANLYIFRVYILDTRILFSDRMLPVPLLRGPCEVFLPSRVNRRRCFQPASA